MAENMGFIVQLVLVTVIVTVSVLATDDISDDCMECIREVDGGSYQITRSYWEDCGSPGEDYEDCVSSSECSEMCVRAYLGQHASSCVRSKNEAWRCAGYGRLHRGGHEYCRCCYHDAFAFGQKVENCSINYGCYEEIIIPEPPPALQLCIPALVYTGNFTGNLTGWELVKNEQDDDTPQPETLVRRRRQANKDDPAMAEACRELSDAVGSEKPYSPEAKERAKNALQKMIRALENQIEKLEKWIDRLNGIIRRMELRQCIKPAASMVENLKRMRKMVAEAEDDLAELTNALLRYKVAASKDVEGRAFTSWITYLRYIFGYELE